MVAVNGLPLPPLTGPLVLSVIAAGVAVAFGTGEPDPAVEAVQGELLSDVSLESSLAQAQTVPSTSASSTCVGMEERASARSWAESLGVLDRAYESVMCTHVRDRPPTIMLAYTVSALRRSVTHTCLVASPRPAYTGRTPI